jgi:hypothetical protein
VWFKVQRSLHTELGGSPLLQQGELDFSPAIKPFILTQTLKPLRFSMQALKRMIKVDLFCTTLKWSAPIRAEGYGL